WSADAREALAKVLGQLTIAEPKMGDLALRLQALMLDSTYAVRRAAFRSMGAQSSSSLYSICQNWMSSEDPELIIRVTEAYTWIETQANGVSDSAVEGLRSFLTTHPNRVIRISARQRLNERRERKWAQHSLAR